MLGGLSSGTFAQLFSRAGLADDEELTDPFLQHWAIYACVKARARAISSAPFKLWASAADDAPEITSGPLVDLFNRPHPMMDGARTWALTSVYMDLSGEAYWLLDKSRTNPGPMRGSPAGSMEATIGVPATATVVPGNRVQVQWDRRTGLPESFDYKPANGDPISYPPESVVSFVDLSSAGNPLRGTGAAEALARRLEVDFKAEKLEMAAADNGGFPSAIVSSEMPLTEAQLDQLESRMERRFNNPGKNNAPAVLPYGFAMQNPGWSPQDMAFPEARDWSLTAIMACFGVTKPILGITDDVNRANAREAKAVFWEDVIVPAQRDLAKTIDERLLSRLREATVPPGATSSFDVSQVEALGDTLGEKIERFKMLRELGIKPEKAAELSNWEVDLSDDDFEEPEPITVMAPQPPTEGPQEPQKGLGAQNRAMAQAPQTAEARDAYARAYADWFGVREQRIESRALLVQRGFLDAVEAKLSNAVRRAAKVRKPEAQAKAGDAESDALREELAILLIPSLEKWAETFAAEVGPELAKTYFEAVANMASELGVSRLVPETDINAVAFLTNKQIQLAEGVMSTLAEEVKRTMARTILAGGDFTLNSLAVQIEQRMEELIAQVQIMRDRLPERAQRIARTESTSVSNAARVAEMKLGGIAEHMWIHPDGGTGDHRQEHIDMGGTTVPIGQEFGHGLRYPGDPQAGASQVVNCHCTTAPVSPFFDDLIDEVED